jgi:hypothetical protein
MNLFEWKALQHKHAPTIALCGNMNCIFTTVNEIHTFSHSVAEKQVIKRLCCFCNTLYNDCMQIRETEKKIPEKGLTGTMGSYWF